MREYASVDPDLPRRMIGDMLAQSAHRRAMEVLVTQQRERRQTIGQIVTSALAALGLGLSAFVGIQGSPIVASVLAVVAVGGPTTAFILARVVGYGLDGAAHR